MTTKNLTRRSPRVSVSMTPETYEGLLRQAAREQCSVSHVVAEVLGLQVARWNAWPAVPKEDDAPPGADPLAR